MLLAKRLVLANPISIQNIEEDHLAARLFAREFSRIWRASTRECSLFHTTPFRNFNGSDSRGRSRLFRRVSENAARSLPPKQASDGLQPAPLGSAAAAPRLPVQTPIVRSGFCRPSVCFERLRRIHRRRARPNPERRLPPPSGDLRSCRRIIDGGRHRHGARCNRTCMPRHDLLHMLWSRQTALVVERQT